MGGLIETDKMLMHIKSCAECRAAASILDRCDDWKEMAENVMDWQCEEGAFEDGQNICGVCDGTVDDSDHCVTCDAKGGAHAKSAPGEAA